MVTTSSTSSTPSQSTFPGTSTSSYTVGTRKSALALIQTHIVADALTSLHNGVSFPVEHTTTIGDRNQSTPLHLLSPYSSSQPAKSLWTDELEALLAAGKFDLLVHSLKDVPTTLKDGFEIGACMKREDPRDAFVAREGSTASRMEDLPEGSVVGTGSVRRVAQLKRAFPGLKFEDMRGNLNTRLSKLDSPTSPFSALILATSGLSRLGQAHRITCPLSSPTLLHAVGQGALGLEIRSGDLAVRELLRKIGHWQTEWTIGAERGMLRVLEGGCSVPVGVESVLEEIQEGEAGWEEEGFASGSVDNLDGSSPLIHFSGILPVDASLPSPTDTRDDVRSKLASRRARLKILASVTSLDGTIHVLHDAPATVVSSWQGAEKWGEECARRLKELGAGKVLDDINQMRKEREEDDAKRAQAAGSTNGAEAVVAA